MLGHRIPPSVDQAARVSEQESRFRRTLVHSRGSSCCLSPLRSQVCPRVPSTDVSKAVVEKSLDGLGDGFSHDGDRFESYRQYVSEL